MPLKPNTWYWFHRPNREPYIEGVTELHEGIPENKNHSGWIHTDANCEVSTFIPLSDEFIWNKTDD